MITTSKEANPNYLAKIFKIEDIKKHPNADRLQIVIVDFMQIITGMNAKLGDYYVYFPSESKINEEFLKFTNSFRDPKLNSNPSEKGMFEANCRTKTIKLRDEFSSGYIIPLNILEAFCKVSGLERFQNEYFDTCNNILMLKKYVPKSFREKTLNQTKSGKTSKISLIKENFFQFHTDTTNLRKNIYNLSPNDYISITYKIHGANLIIAKVPIKVELNTIEKGIKYLSKKIKSLKVNIVEEKYGIVISSRRVIKTVDDRTFEGNNFYDSDIWTFAGENIKNKIPESYSLYCELCGFTQTGSPIQGEYTYGCSEKQHKIYVFKVVYTNPEGIRFILSTKESKEFCDSVGLEFVPIFYNGVAKDLFPNISIETHWHENFLKELENKFTEKDCYICKKSGLPEEGIVLRI